MAALGTLASAIQSKDEMFEGIRCNPMLDHFLALDRRASETPDAPAILAQTGILLLIET
jgi:hypothetical protein